MIHEHNSLVGCLIGQARSQADRRAGQSHLGIWLLLLMQEGVTHHLYTTHVTFSDLMHTAHHKGVPMKMMNFQSGLLNDLRHHQAAASNSLTLQGDWWS